MYNDAEMTAVKTCGLGCLSTKDMICDEIIIIIYLFAIKIV